MDSTKLISLLDRQTKVIKILTKMVKKQHSALRNRKVDAAEMIDRRKQQLLRILTDIDTEINAAGKLPEDKELEQAIEQTNLALFNLLMLEKENDLLITEYGGMMIGSHINSYKQFK